MTEKTEVNQFEYYKVLPFLYLKMKWVVKGCQVTILSLLHNLHTNLIIRF